MNRPRRVWFILWHQTDRRTPLLFPYLTFPTCLDDPTLFCPADLTWDTGDLQSKALCPKAKHLLHLCKNVHAQKWKPLALLKPKQKHALGTRAPTEEYGVKEPDCDADMTGAAATVTVIHNSLSSAPKIGKDVLLGQDETVWQSVATQNQEIALLPCALSQHT